MKPYLQMSFLALKQPEIHVALWSFMNFRLRLLDKSSSFVGGWESELFGR